MQVLFQEFKKKKGGGGSSVLSTISAPRSFTSKQIRNLVKNKGGGAD